MLGAMTSLVLSGSAHEVDPLQKRLVRTGIEVPIIRWGQRRLLRVSAQLYNSEDEFRRLAATMADT